MKNLFIIALCLFIGYNANAQKPVNDQKVVLVTLDGCRWNDIFGGADSVVLFNPKFNKKFASDLKKKYWAANANARREKLMPFLWNVIGKKGVVGGNRNYGNNVQVSNPYNYSYPGYAEIFTGYADSAIKNNDLIYNRNTSLFEFVNKQNGFKDKVAAFASWDRVNYYLNEPRAKFLVNGGYEEMKSEALSDVERKLNTIQATAPLVVSSSSRPDFLTWGFASEYIKRTHPRLVSLGFAYTDDFAHGGDYPLYLEQIHAFDAYLAQLWAQLQADPFYKDKTTILITVDHGRGLGEQWTSHGSNIPHSNEIWFAMMGPSVPASGELKQPVEIYQNQFAQTAATVLGMTYTAEHRVGKAIAVKDLK